MTADGSDEIVVIEMSDETQYTSRRAYAWAGLFLGLCGGVFSLPTFDAGLVPIPAGAALGYLVGIGLHRTRSWPQERFFQRVLRQFVVWCTALMALNDLARLAGLQSRDGALQVLSLLPGVTLVFVVSHLAKLEHERAAPRDTTGGAILLGVLVMCVLWYFGIEWYRTGTLGPLFA